MLVHICVPPTTKVSLTEVSVIVGPAILALVWKVTGGYIDMQRKQQIRHTIDSCRFVEVASKEKTILDCRIDEKRLVSVFDIQQVAAQ